MTSHENEPGKRRELEWDHKSAVDYHLDLRRRQLRMTWRQIAQQAGISSETLRKLRLGEPVSELTEAGIEDTLNWPRGDLRMARAGLRPIPLEESQAAKDRLEELDRKVGAFRREVDDLRARGLARTVISVSSVEHEVTEEVYVDHPRIGSNTAALLRGFAEAVEKLEEGKMQKEARDGRNPPPLRPRSPQDHRG